MSHILVLGLGKAGTAAARHALNAGDDVTVYAGKAADPASSQVIALQEAGAQVICGTEDVQGSYDLCVASPGISCNSAFYAAGKEHAAELVGECEYAFRLSPDNWIAITGTNGKTTTTALTAHLLNAAGCLAYPCGNIGDTCTASVDHRKPGETLVAEMSSYGLASTSRFAPKVAALLNITPDHLSWHGTHEAYAAAKLKIFANMTAGNTAVICDEVPACDELASSLQARGVRVVIVGADAGDNCAFADADGMLCVRLDGKTVQLVKTSELKIKGPHNVKNALAAAACALAYGCSAAGVAAGLAGFTALEHRIEPVGTVAGVSFYNDSKGTNVDATLVALKAFEGHPIVLLAGGRDKGTDLSGLVEACTGPVRCVICYGEAAERFFEAFEAGSVAHERAAGMREAFARAVNIAQEGDVILLSPACASFDEFNSFEHRGEVFKELVAGLQG